MQKLSTITDLKIHFEQAVRNETLELTAFVSAADKLKSFLQTLPRQQIDLLKPSFVVSPETPQTLIIESPASEDWTIRGTHNKSVHINQVTLIFAATPEGFESQMHFEGTITVGSAQIPVKGVLGADDHLDFGIDSNGNLSHSLSEIADFLSHNSLSAFLPAEIGIFDVVPLSGFSFSFGFRRSAVTRFGFTSNVNGEWQIIEGWASLKKIGISLYAESSFRTVFEQSVGGDIHGTLHLDQDYAVRIVLAGRNYWRAEVIPKDGNLLPGLATLAGLAGGEALKQSVQHGLDKINLGAISIDGVFIAFDLAARKFDGIQFNGHITIEKVNFFIQASLPNFEFYGNISPETPIHLQELIGRHFSGVEAFPKVDVDTLSIYAQPGAGRYEFNASVTSDFKIHIGTVALEFTRLDLNINKEAGGTTGFIDGRLKLAAVEMEVSAEHLETDSGWQFRAASQNDKEIPIGDFLKNLAFVFGTDADFPTAITGLTIKNIVVSFDTKTRNFIFSCESRLPVGEQDLNALITINLTKVEGRYRKEFSGRMVIGARQFDIKFDQENASTVFAAFYTHSAAQSKINIKQFIADVSAPTADYIPETLEIDLKSVLFGFSKSTGESKFIFGMSIGVEMNLSNLPLIGKEFPADKTVGVSDLQLLVTSEAITAGEAKIINRLAPKELPGLPDTTDQTEHPETDRSAAAPAVSKGLTVSAKMIFGDLEESLTLSASVSKSPDKAVERDLLSAADSTVAADGAKWFNLQKKFGPLYFERVGVQYRDEVLAFLLDAALTAAGLTISLEGLSVGSSLKEFNPQFNLRGLGIDYKNGVIEIGAAFFKGHGEKDGVAYDEYSGLAILKTAQFSLSAVGAYANFNNQPSMFIYAVLDYPIGGESYFFITGLAAGFGYNRRLKVPSVDKIAGFPLVSLAVSPSSQETDPKNQLRILGDYIPPSIGDVFLAVGIKFTSFKMIDSFALLTLAFGSRFEINLLGISTMAIPTTAGGEAVMPLAVAQMAFKASFVPEEGFLGVSAQLTSASYILSKDCHLTGGFAFCCWFVGEHTGDFVLSLGGYHPELNVPKHYPAVPPLGLNWRFNENISFKGSIYFALTPAALMAGGRLQALLTYGNFSAWFNASVDFIVSWQPYHYDAKVHIDVGVSYNYEFFGRHQLNFNIGADLHIWGPEFTGTATLKFQIFSFEVNFGKGALKSPEPINWEKFKKSFLPTSDKEICSITIKRGLTGGSQKGDSLGTVNPTTLSIVTYSVIPSNAAHIEKALPAAEIGQPARIGIGSMAIKPDEFSSVQTIIIERIGEDSEKPAQAHRVEADFEFVPVLKNVPAGMWGEELTPGINGKSLINGALTGFEIRAKEPPKAGASITVESENLQYADLKPFGNALRWRELREFKPALADEAQRRRELENSLASEQTAGSRRRILQSLGIAEEIDLTERLADDFLAAPLMEM